MWSFEEKLQYLDKKYGFYKCQNYCINIFYAIPNNFIWFLLYPFPNTKSTIKYFLKICDRKIIYYSHTRFISRYTILLLWIYIHMSALFTLTSSQTFTVFLFNFFRYAVVRHSKVFLWGIHNTFVRQLVVNLIILPTM